jgi:hypothetical protein
VDYLLGTYCSKSEGKRDTVFIFVKQVQQEYVPDLEIEIQDAKWFPLDNLPEKITKPTFWRVEEYQSGIRDVNGFWTKPYEK